MLLNDHDMIKLAFKTKNLKPHQDERTNVNASSKFKFIYNPLMSPKRMIIHF